MNLIETIQAIAATVAHPESLIIWGAALAGTVVVLIRQVAR